MVDKIGNFARSGRTFLFLHLLWLLAVGGSVAVNHYYAHQETENIALAQARTLAQRDQAFLDWLAAHGHIYAPISVVISPNPLLAEVPFRDLVRSDGLELTLLNPAYLIALVNEGGRRAGGVWTRFTSERPLSPNNQPDSWELSAFSRLGQGETEVAEFITEDKRSYLRYFRASIVQAGCLECHAGQGYRVGALAGGINVFLPLDELLAGHKKGLRAMIFWHSLLYLAGVFFLFWGRSLLCRKIAERDLAQAELVASEEKYRTMIDYTYAWEYWLNPDGTFRHVSPSVAEVTGYPAEKFLADPEFCKSLIVEDDHEILHKHLTDEGLSHGKCEIDFRIRTAAGETRWLRHICRPIHDAAGSFLGRRASNYDITAQKQAEEAREGLIGELQGALGQVKLLSGLLPICASCKKIRDDKGYWSQIESYISQHSDAVFSHGICPDCCQRLYPEFSDELKDR